MEYTKSEFDKMNAQLKRMGINFENIGKVQKASLPPLPSSDPIALQRNTYSSFYKTGSRDFWGQSHLERIEVQDFKRCLPHHFVKRGEDKVMCVDCHAGWQVPNTYKILDGQLYDGETHLQFT
jgi:hypothetical protein